MIKFWQIENIFVLSKQTQTFGNSWRKKNPDEKPNLRDANLKGAKLVNANLRNADLRNANLAYANLERANLSDADLRGADLSVATFSSAILSRADFSGARLNVTDFRGARLREVNFQKADIWGASFQEADLWRANLTEAKVGNTIFGDLDLRTVKGLETIQHRYPSTVGIDTIMRSEGDIPEIFLRGVGLDDIFITYVLSLAKKPIQYYTCFISYSSKDQAFAERLYADLQNKNVRCWFAPEDLKIGDKFRVRIDESIRLYDKLLLILSEHSVRSPWVEIEVETAFSKEHKTGKLALFPVKLDNTVEETEEAWAATIHRTRHIGDFTRWKEHDEYQKR